MYLNIKIILLLSLLVIVFANDHKLKKNRKVKKGLQLKPYMKVVRTIRQAIEENKDEKVETMTKETPKIEPKEEKEEPKEEKAKEEPKISPKEGEKIEREDEDEEKVSSESPKEAEIPTRSTTAFPPLTLPTTPPTIATPPTVPNNNFPRHHWNYWETPGWGTWGRHVPTHNWPQVPQQWPSMAWPSVPQYPTYSPGVYSPGTFGGMPNSGIPTFSFAVPHNPWPANGFQFPSASPAMPSYPGFAPPSVPGVMPGYQPGFRPSNGPPPGFQPGVAPMPGYQPRAAPGGDPNRPLGPMGPEFNDPDVTMIDPNLIPGNNGRFPGKIMAQ